MYLHLAAFLVVLSVWTWKLLEPNPVPEDARDLLSADAKFLIAKSLHAGGYAVLAVLAATTPVSRRWRRVLVGLVALHGIATEVAQYLMAVGRTGKVTDVLIDWAGIAAGLLAVRVMGSRTRRGC